MALPSQCHPAPQITMVHLNLALYKFHYLLTYILTYFARVMWVARLNCECHPINAVTWQACFAMINMTVTQALVSFAMSLCRIILSVILPSRKQIITGVRAIFSRGAEPSLPQKFFQQRPKNCYASLQKLLCLTHPTQ